MSCRSRYYMTNQRYVCANSCSRKIIYILLLCTVIKPLEQFHPPILWSHLASIWHVYLIPLNRSASTFSSSANHFRLGKFNSIPLFQEIVFLRQNAVNVLLKTDIKILNLADVDYVITDD